MAQDDLDLECGSDAGKALPAAVESVIMVALIYGAGAVGLGLGSCLLSAGAEVDLIGRQDTVSSLRKHGLLRTGIFGSYHAGPTEFGSYSSLNELPPRNYDYILACVNVKSFDSRDSAQDLAAHTSILGNQTKIILSQNGWGNAETFASFFDKGRIYNARVITGFEMPNRHTVVVTVHADAIHVGSLYGADLSCVEPLCEFLWRGGIPCKTTDAIDKDLWAKMLYNCSLNPLGAILECPYGALGESEFARSIMDRIVHEVFTVMAAAGFKTHFRTPEAFLEVFYNRLVPDTAEHRSSTLQDIQAGRRTEIDALNGAVLKLAAKYGVDIPCNRAVFNLVKFLEAENL